MILSMTGYGSALVADGGLSYALEIRTVNNRYLKVSLKLPDFLQFAEVEIEKMLRARVARGSVDYLLKVRSADQGAPRTIRREVVQRYVELLSAIEVPGRVQPTIDLAAIAALPGVCDDPEWSEESRAQQLGILKELTVKALDCLTAMRRDEGQALRRDLLSSCQALREKLAAVSTRAPSVIDEYHQRLQSRVATLMRAGGFELEADGLMREVAIYAERCDISEEITRFASHLEQFEEKCDREEQVGRTLDFLTQELLREANTIASKCNDSFIARHIVEVKGLIDRLREQVQNVE
jgi:uncharacterized protein (TIGR00255 family)